jgi:hypothetical protein
MKITLTFPRVILFTSALVAASSYGNTFDYSFSFADFGAVSGSFDGTQNGNLINGITNVSLLINGNSTDVGAGIFAEGYDASHKFQNGLAQVSIDGSQNNFMFVNGDAGAGKSYTGYFFSQGNGSGNPDLMEASDTAHGFYDYNLAMLTSSNWKVAERSTQSVPDTNSTVGMLGSACVALAAFRRRFPG